MDIRFDALKDSIDKRFDAVDALEQARYATLIAKIEAIRTEFASTEAISSARHDAILKALDIDKRLERVKARQAAGTAA